MSGLIQVNRYSFQPSQGTRIARNQALTSGLVFAWNGAQPTRDFSGNRIPGTINTIVSGVGKAGRSPSFSGAAAKEISFNRDTRLEPAVVSFAAYFNRTGALNAGGAIVFVKEFNNNTSQPFTSYGIRGNDSGAGQNVVTVTIGTATIHELDLSITPDVTQPTLVVGTYDGTNLNGYVGAKLSDTSAPGGAIGYDTTAAGNLVIGAVEDTAGNQGWLGNIYMVAVWNRVLTAGDVALLAVAPFRIFASQPRRWWINSVSAGGGTYYASHARRTPRHIASPHT